MTFGPQEALRSRDDFPALSRQYAGHPIAYFDGPGGTQVPRSVLAAIENAYIKSNANFDGCFATSVAAGESVLRAREAACDFLGASSPACISFGANMTTLNYALSHALVRSMQPGDEVLITELDHEANRGPWLQLQDRGIVVREAALNPDGWLDQEDLIAKITDKTRVVAVGIASNALGTVTALGPIRQRCRETGAYLVVDAVHYAAHSPLDVMALDVDFLLCSAYKFYGPHIGILYCREGLLDTLETDHLRTQKDAAPYRIETGTLNQPALAGVAAAIDYIAEYGAGDTRREKLIDAMRQIARYEHSLARRYYNGVVQIPGVRAWGPVFDDNPRAPTVSVSFDGTTPESVAARLGEQGLQVWHGHFYAIKVLEVLDLVSSGGLLRVGMSMYNTDDEVERLLDALEAALRRP